MDDFESVYLQDEFNNSNARRLCALDRLKIGEIFQVRQNQFVFSCIHCTQEFQQFARFSDHVQSHYHSALQWLAPQINDASHHAHANDVLSGMAPAPGMDMENVEYLLCESSNDDSTCEEEEEEDAAAAAAENRHETNMNTHMPENIECKVSIREGGDDTESMLDTSNENDEPVSLETRFKLKHPLIRVKDTADARKLLPYFSKKYTFARTEEQHFKCPLCDYYAISKANIREHIFTHAEMKMFACKLCNKDFSRPRNIIVHVEQKHSDVAVLTPERTPKKLKVEKINAASHMGGRSNNILNNISPKMKINTKMMYSIGVDGDKSRSQCFICMKTFSRPNGIVKHMKTHTQEKNYQCFTCGSQFSRSDHLSRHMLIHDPPKYKCDICDMTFRRSDKMLVHRRKHPDAMNYTCENCGLGFMELTSIKTHVNFHCKGRIDVKNELPPVHQISDFHGQQTAELNIETHPGGHLGQSIEGSNNIELNHSMN